jgi:hypothetical protein
MRIRIKEKNEFWHFWEKFWDLKENENKIVKSEKFNRGDKVFKCSKNSGKERKTESKKDKR